MRFHVVQGTRLPFEQPHHRGTLKRGFCSVPGPQGEGAGPFALVCGWCGALVMEGRGPASHGICGHCLEERHPLRVAMNAVTALASLPAVWFFLVLVFP